MIIDVVGERVEKYMFLNTVDKYVFNNTDYNFRNTFSIPNQLRVIFYDTPPYSYRSLDNRILGVDGNVMDEFCKRNNVSYRITNNKFEPFDIQYSNDIILYRRFNSISTQYIEITLNDHGANQCFLVPRNIPVYSHLFSNPFQKNVSLIFIATAVFIGIMWKFLKLVRKQDIGMFKLITSILKIICGHSIDKGEISQNRLLLVPFILICFILMDIFKSFLISTSIIEPPMRSVQSLIELNDSDTKVYEYYEEIKFFAPEKVIHKIPLRVGYTALSMLPENVDTSLAYGVRCRFGQEFVGSKQNFENDRQLFDFLSGYAENRYASYLVHENFPLKSRFIALVTSLQESGILNFWTEIIVRESFPKHFQNETENALSIKAMYLPLLILVVGLFISFIVFLLELIYFRYSSWKSCEIIDLRKERMKRKRLHRYSRYLRMMGWKKR